MSNQNVEYLLSQDLKKGDVVKIGQKLGGDYPFYAEILTKPKKKGNDIIFDYELIYKKNTFAYDQKVIKLKNYE